MPNKHNAAKGFRPQHFADGGFVHSIKGALGLRPKTPEELMAADAQRMAKNREAAAAVAARSKTTQPAQQEQQEAVSSYAGMSATQRREKELGLKDGGRVRPRGFVAGPGTETSDSIPARLSDGEYVLPADTVRAVGVDKLDALRDATHTPARGFSGKQGKEFFFAGGGSVQEEFMQGMEQARASRRQQATAMANEAMAQSQADSDEAAAQRSPALAPASPASPSIGQMHSAGSRSGGQMLADGMTGAARGFFGSFQKAPDAPAAPVVTTAMATNPTDQRLAAGTKTTPGGLPAAPAAAPTSNEVAPGVYQHGKGQFSDNAAGMGFKPGFTGQPNAQNMAAADALAGRSQQESMARVAAPSAVGFQPAGVTAPTVRHSGNDWQARNDLRNAQVSASSITQSDKWGKGGDRTATAQYQGLQEADKAARGFQPAIEQTALRENASIQREGMQQAGATDRAARGFAVDQQRLGIEGRRADGEAEARGFQIRAAAQQERLRSVLTDPNATAADKAQAQAALLALNGKGDSWKAVALQGGTDAQGNKTESILGAVNERTGEMKRMEGQGGAQKSGPVSITNDDSGRQAFAALPSGAEFIGPDGKTYRKG